VQLSESVHMPSQAVQCLLAPTQMMHSLTSMCADSQCVPLLCHCVSGRGHLRTNAAGANLNREWDKPSYSYSPEVCCIAAWCTVHTAAVQLTHCQCSTWTCRSIGRVVRKARQDCARPSVSRGYPLCLECVDTEIVRFMAHVICMHACRLLLCQKPLSRLAWTCCWTCTEMRRYQQT
jgi:hypothetical protein